MILLERRVEKFKEVIAKRQLDIAIVLENVHDPHNIGAVLRSCDSVGIQNIYIVNTDPRIQDRKRYDDLKTSSGAAKWLNIHYYEELDLAIREIKEKYKRLIATHLSSEAKSLYEIEFTESFALAFGNEHEGITDAFLAHADANLIVPQHGMVQSLNISVACAVCLFEISRQRGLKSAYSDSFDSNSLKQTELLEEWIGIHEASKMRKKFR